MEPKNKEINAKNITAVKDATYTAWKRKSENSGLLGSIAHPVACCWVLLRVVAQSLKPVKLFSQQLPTFLLFRDRRSVAQQCWIRLHSSSNIVGATHAHYAWFTKVYGLHPFHDALQVPTLLGVVASICTPLPTRTKEVRTLLAQQCWELLRPFARSLSSSPRSIYYMAWPRMMIFFTFISLCFLPKGFLWSTVNSNKP